MDTSADSWPQKIAPAAKRYREKFGLPVGEVHVHAAEGDEAPTDWDRPDGVSIPVYRDAKPRDHLLLCQAPVQEMEITTIE